MTFIRSLAAAAIGVCGVAMAGTGLASIPGPGSIDFTVARDGSPMGHHTVRFEERDGALHVFVDIELTVDFAFITAYRYEHENHEIWRNGRLVSLTSTTNDDGDRYEVKVRPEGDRLRVTTQDRSFLVDGDILSTSYWHPETMRQDRLLDSAKGEVVQVESTPVGTTEVSLENGSVTACHWRTRGDLNADFWYDRNGHWVKLAFDAKGSDIEYTFEGGPETLTATASVPSPNDETGRVQLVDLGLATPQSFCP